MPKSKNSNPEAKVASKYPRKKAAPKKVSIRTWIPPDWRDASAYPFKGVNHNQFSWEFLRRNKEYQSLYNELIHPFFDVRGHFKIEDSLSNIRRGKYKKYAKNNDISSIQRIFREKFGVDFRMSLPSPYWINEFSVFFYLPHESGILYERPKNLIPEEIYIEEIELRDHQICCVFDVSAPINPQVDALKKYISKIQKNKPIEEKKNRMDLYIEYLRILDAYEVGASIGEIAEQLYSKADDESKRTVRNRYNAALKMRASGYKYLINNKSDK